MLDWTGCSERIADICADGLRILRVQRASAQRSRQNSTSALSLVLIHLLVCCSFFGKYYFGFASLTCDLSQEKNKGFFFSALFCVGVSSKFVVISCQK